jgi:tripartite-type tricarboxylate transporter receptor subunit TctC
MRRWLGFAFLLVFAVMFRANAIAQSFPERTVTIVVGLTPGGNVDSVARVIGSKLQDVWRKPVIVENRPGASETLAAEQVARLPADGYTIGLFSNSFAINETATPQRRYAAGDFKPVAKVVEMPFVIATGASNPAQSLADLVRLAKAQPGRLNYAHIGVASPQYLTMEWLKKAADIDIMPVPYRGSPAAVGALLSGDVDFAVASGSSIPLIESGKIRALTVMADRRTEVFPTLPVVGELGFPRFHLVPWAGAFVRAGTPASIVQQIESEIAKIVRSPEFVSQMVRLGNTASLVEGSEFDDLVSRDIVEYGQALSAAGLKSN